MDVAIWTEKRILQMISDGMEKSLHLDYEAPALSQKFLRREMNWKRTHLPFTSATSLEIAIFADEMAPIFAQFDPDEIRGKWGSPLPDASP